MRIFQAIEAQYSAIRAIQAPYAGDNVARLVATLCVVTQLFPAMYLWLGKAGSVAQALALAVLVLISAACLDARREMLAEIYWDRTWSPNLIQRLTLATWAFAVLFGVAICARHSIAGSLAIFITLGSLPLRTWINRVGQRGGAN
jgi:hypothetical protein